MTSAWPLLSLLAAGRAIAGTNADVAPDDPVEVPTARPVVPLDDTRSHGPTARNVIDVSETLQFLISGQRTTTQFTSQLAIGFPRVKLREVRALYDRYHLLDYQLRIRSELFGGYDDASGANGGPLTFAVQRYLPISPLAIDPLLYAHVGIEAALSTPWLSGRHLRPESVIQVIDGPDAELASDGWSVRPASVYFRGDFLACRSESVDVGVEPELFAPTDGAHELGTRFHLAAGFSLGCHGNMSPHAPKITAEYRGRVRMYKASDPVAYADNLAIGLQLDLGPVMIQTFYKADPGRLGTAGAIGVRLQLGRAR